MQRMRLKPPHVALLMLGLGGLLHVMLPLPLWCSSGLPVWGAISLLPGLVLMIWAWKLFWQSGTTIQPDGQASFLVTTGPYRITRNPMYLGITLVLTGVACAVGSITMLVAPLGFYLCMNLLFIPGEEQRLEQIFGDLYHSYTSRTRRWL